MNFYVGIKVDAGELSDWPAENLRAFFSGIAKVLAVKARVVAPKLVAPILAVAALLWTLPAAAQIQAVVFQPPIAFSGPPATSVILTNIGQSAHLLRVEFAGVVPVAGIQVRLEASYDGVNFFPIMEDITDAPLLNGGVYAFGRCFGPFPALRVRSLIAVPSAMTVRYTGHMLPTQPAIALLADRFAF